MNKQELLAFLVKNRYILIDEKFTGQITLVCNINQGGITDIERSIKERIR
jgi:hypothetical protein